MYALVGLGSAQLPTDPAFYSKMTYDESVALRKQFSEPERQAMLQAAVDALPACYGAQTQKCVRGIDWNALGPERCLVVNRGYLADWDRFEKYIDSLPFCEEQSGRNAGLIGGGIGLALGLMVGLIAASSMR